MLVYHCSVSVLSTCRALSHVHSLHAGLGRVSMRLRRSCSVSQPTAGAGCYSTAGTLTLSLASISSTCAHVGPSWGPLLAPSYISLGSMPHPKYTCRFKKVSTKSGVGACSPKGSGGAGCTSCRLLTDTPACHRLLPQTPAHTSVQMVQCIRASAQKRCLVGNTRCAQHKQPAACWPNSTPRGIQ